MIAPLPDHLQPYGVEIKMADGIFVKQMAVPMAGTIIPQHSHVYAHLSMLACGSVRMWKDGVDMGEFRAPRGIMIAAGSKHTFKTLEDKTVIYCIHHIKDAGGVSIEEEHQISGVT